MRVRAAHKVNRSGEKKKMKIKNNVMKSNRVMFDFTKVTFKKNMVESRKQRV